MLAAYLILFRRKELHLFLQFLSIHLKNSRLFSSPPKIRRHFMLNEVIKPLILVKKSFYAFSSINQSFNKNEFQHLGLNQTPAYTFSVHLTSYLLEAKMREMSIQMHNYEFSIYEKLNSKKKPLLLTIPVTKLSVRD